MAKIVKELLTKWTYKVDARQLKATAQVIKDLHASMMAVRRESVGFEKGEVQRLARIQAGWRNLNGQVRQYRTNLRGASGVGAAGAAGAAGGGGKGGRGRKRPGGIFGNQSTAFLAGNVLKSPIVGSALLAAGGNPAILAGLAAAGLVGTSVAAASRKQQAEVGLRTFARAESGGDADVAKEKTTEFLGELNSFAKRTPFGVSQLRDLALRMKGFGFATAEVIPTLQQLGDLTGGRADVLQRMLVNLAQIRNLGKAQTVDLKQIANAGIPIQQKLADMLGKTRKELALMIPLGQVTAAHIARAFREMTTEGGLFFGQMLERSKTLNGQWEKLKENFTLFKEELGGTSIGPLTKLLTFINDAIDSFAALFTAMGKGADRIGKVTAEWTTFNKIMKILGDAVKFSLKNLVTLIFFIPLALEDIGAFFAGKESFFGDLMKWFGFVEGDDATDVIMKGFNKIKSIVFNFFDGLGTDIGNFWDKMLNSEFVNKLKSQLESVSNSIANAFSTLWRGLQSNLDRLDTWFEATTLGQFIKRTIGTDLFNKVFMGNRLAADTAPPTESQTIQGSSSSLNDLRSQQNTFNINQSQLPSTLAAATDQGILNSGSRQFQSSFVV